MKVHDLQQLVRKLLITSVSGYLRSEGVAHLSQGGLAKERGLCADY